MTAANDSTRLPPATPLDVRQALTKAEDVAFPLRWGIVGAGSISTQWVGCLRACAGATVAAVAARDAQRAQAFAARHGIPAAYGSYQALVAADDVDIVYIGTITRLHKAHALLAIAAGKHVLCEKALAENVQDAGAMHAAAREAGVMLQDAMWTRFFPAVEHARAAIEAGVIGEPVLVQSDFFDPIYTIQAATLAFGATAQATKVTASGRRAGAAIVEYGDGKCAVLTFPPSNSELAETTEIIGTKGRITLEQPGHCPTAITIRVPEPGGVPSRYRTPQRSGTSGALRVPAAGRRWSACRIPESAGLPLPSPRRPSLSRRRPAQLPAIRRGGLHARDGSAYPHQSGAVRVAHSPGHGYRSKRRALSLVTRAKSPWCSRNWPTSNAALLQSIASNRWRTTPRQVWRAHGAVLPATLLQRRVQQIEIRRWPVRIAQVPDQVVEVAALGVAALQHRVQFAGKQRGLIMMMQSQHHVATHQTDVGASALRRIGVYFDLDGEHLGRVRRQPQLVKKPRKPHQTAVNGTMLPNAQLDSIPLRGEFIPHRLQILRQVVALLLLLQGKVQVLGVARQRKQKAQAGAALKGERQHGPRVLHRTENASLQVFAHEVSPLHRRGALHQRFEIVLHSGR